MLKETAAGRWCIGRRPPATGYKRHCAFPAVASLTELLLLSASFGCDARLSKSAARKPASIGRLRVGCPKTRVEWAFQPGVAGNARKHWASGKALRRSPFYAGFGADTVAVLWQVLSSVCGCRRRDSAGDASPSLFSSCYLVSGALTGDLQRCVLLQPPRRCDKKWAQHALKRAQTVEWTLAGSPRQ